MDLYTVSFALESNADRSSPRRLERRFELLDIVLGRVARASARPVLATSAGFLRVANIDLRDQVAERLGAASLRHRVGLIVGIDVLEDEEVTPWGPQPDSYLLALDRGRPLVWPLGRHDSLNRPAPLAEIDGLRIGLVVSQDLFNGAEKRVLAQRAPHVIVVPTHTPVTDRWEHALAKWSRVAPVVIVDPLLDMAGQRRRKSAPAPEIARQVICQTPSFTLYQQLLTHSLSDTDERAQRLLSAL